MVKTLLLGDQQVSVPGFGAMGLNSAMGTDFNFEQSEPVLSKAVELGCTFWDTAVSSPFTGIPRHDFLSNITLCESRWPTKTERMRS